jgi:hypothetical protein
MLAGQLALIVAALFAGPVNHDIKIEKRHDNRRTDR